MTKNEVKYLRSENVGVVILIITNLKTKNQTFFMLDPWKVGIMEFEMKHGNLDQIKKEFQIDQIEFHEIDKEKAFQLLAQNYRISSKLHLKLNNEIISWLNQNGISNIKTTGSLYKCFNCEVNDLSDEDVTEILKFARKDIKKNLVGKSTEKQYYYVCQKCKDDLHKQHKNIDLLK